MWRKYSHVKILSNDNQISWQHFFLQTEFRPTIFYSSKCLLHSSEQSSAGWLNNWKQISLVKCQLCNNLCILDIWKSTPTPKRKAGGSDFHLSKETKLRLQQPCFTETAAFFTGCGENIVHSYKNNNQITVCLLPNLTRKFKWLAYCLPRKK